MAKKICSVHRASGSGRIWNFKTRGRLAVPPSEWNGERVELVDQMARHFQPLSGSGPSGEGVCFGLELGA